MVCNFLSYPILKNLNFIEIYKRGGNQIGKIEYF
ncbi:hypothetical protein Bccel_0724 [Pseudobacteroides cellulosolvens ATCC 35603 = DSM 2933]|uniref:Uncharacterized protein n=1 Tax=Pseudobacteroides cellulosolvens ATCC 35603 = DSM 2933 TaxID=398512 RepID=A0A0L6JIA3_9FIRM|nr:hypothetical protein Bccel_0724 [Pseudobacteroides cellulosolvens ATCC 35603 = DSM 2933]